jgi:hypothetical protein
MVRGVDGCDNELMTSWCHSSAADGEAPIDGGLLSNRRVATCVASTPITGSGVQTVPAMRWCCVTVAAIMAIEWPPARWDLPT